MTRSRLAFVVALLGSLLCTDASAQRSIRIDASGEKWTMESETGCNAAGSGPYWLDVSGVNLVSPAGESPALTFAGFTGVSGSVNVFCQQTEDYDWSSSLGTPFNNDPLIQTLILDSGLTKEDVYGERYTFTTSDSIYALRAAGIPGFAAYADPLAPGDTAIAYQWEFTFFENAVIGALMGPRRFEGSDSGLLSSALGLDDSRTFLRVGHRDYGGNSFDLETNYLCFGAGGGSFLGVIEANQLGACLSGNPVAVPVPGTLGLLSVGVGALWASRRMARMT